mmetsp:Transcript_90690/g.290694  ORF Transcript_90690/g.290694 Transcript_90690/m.290694 type:complete len:270 (+) Transcript_90690:220-1029(+)
MRATWATVPLWATASRSSPSSASRARARPTPRCRPSSRARSFWTASSCMASGEAAEAWRSGSGSRARRGGPPSTHSRTKRPRAGCCRTRPHPRRRGWMRTTPSRAGTIVARREMPAPAATSPTFPMSRSSRPGRSRPRSRTRTRTGAAAGAAAAAHTTALAAANDSGAAGVAAAADATAAAAAAPPAAPFVVVDAGAIGGGCAAGGRPPAPRSLGARACRGLGSGPGPRLGPTLRCGGPDADVDWHSLRGLRRGWHGCPVGRIARAVCP